MSAASFWPTRPATARTCSCGAAIIAGLSEGVPVRVDVHALTVEGELAAILAGRMTFTLVGGALVHRDEFRIKVSRKGPIFASHKCRTRIDPRYCEILKMPTPRKEAESNEPGY
jgi:hypothetical protein